MDGFGLCLNCFVILLVFTVNVFSLKCYHDAYIPPNNTDGNRLPVTPKLDKSAWKKQCGIMDGCLSCMTITTRLTRYIKRHGQQETRIQSRVCRKTREMEMEEGCEILGAANPAGETTICHCFVDKCNQ